ncbi:MAG: cytochrome-c oxidase, cbb3-type subunit III [Robiginitomaculum sp.]|nr:MAG: cytochrome-c oxidase, cbb3-type subunit III [Robiginitomaculum sp.]
MTDKPELDGHSGVFTTGHEWDGIRELNTPLPKWWLYINYISIIWAIIYCIFMPSWPGLPGMGYFKGLRHHSERANVAVALDKLQAARAANAQSLTSVSLDQVENDPDLLTFAMAAGRSAFGDNCATCHGSNGIGSIGFPALNDDVWLWGGNLDEIKQTITYGIRSGHDEAHFSQMPAFGRDELLSVSEISDLTELVLAMGGSDHDQSAATRATVNFDEQCSICHAEDGTGDRYQGAPNLIDSEWLYGGSRRAITETITNSRFGIMPTWEQRLQPWTIDSLAVYVHSLGGGE